MEQVYGRGSAVEGGSHPDPGTGLEEPILQLALEGRGGGGGDSVYPERPGEPDCNYYMRTGSCGYGERCRYNHPRNRAMIAASARTGGGEYPERAGQPLCRYFLKTGTCKFGATCKYHHPRQGGPVYPPQPNFYGYPLRPGEKECSYYVKTGHCKFGATCKFHHPQPAVTSVPAPAPPFYPTMQSPSVHSPHQFSAVAGWQVARSPPQMPGSYVQGPYGHVILASGMVPGWSPFPPPVNQVVPPGGQPAVEAGSLYGLSPQLSPSVPTYIGPYQPVSPSAGPSSSGQREHLFPERPGQPECQYYMKTGDCKFGSTCKYHHPPERSLPKTSYFLNPMGLPLRPGAPSCTFFAQHGVCKFGPSCKFDHPVAILGYGPSASSLSDMPVAAPFPVGLSPELLAPSSSSTDLRHEFVAGPSNKDSFSTQMPSGGNTSSSSIGSIFSKDEIVSHSFVQAPLQSSTPSSSSSSISHGGEVTSSR